jgi:hypothetical protein
MTGGVNDGIFTLHGGNREKNITRDKSKLAHIGGDKHLLTHKIIWFPQLAPIYIFPLHRLDRN